MSYDGRLPPVSIFKETPGLPLVNLMLTLDLDATKPFWLLEISRNLEVGEGLVFCRYLPQASFIKNYGIWASGHRKVLNSATLQLFRTEVRKSYTLLTIPNNGEKRSKLGAPFRAFGDKGGPLVRSGSPG